MALAIACCQLAQAQLFKKLKDEVANTVSSKPSATAGVLPADNVKPTHADLSKFNTKHFYTLQDGEKFSFYEACLLVQADQLSPQFMVVKDGKTFTIDANGQHVPADPGKISGCAQDHISRPEQVPFDRLKGDREKNYQEDTLIYSVQSPGLMKMIKGIDTAALRRAAASGDRAAIMEQAMAMNNQMTKNQAANGNYRMHVYFRGKDYGEYDGFTEPVFDKGARNFYVIAYDQKPENANAAKTGQPYTREAWLIGSNGSKIKVPGVGQILATDDFSFLRILVVDMGRNGTSYSQSIYDPKTAKSVPLPAGSGMDQSIDMKTGHVISTQVNGQDNKVYIDSKLVRTLTNDPGVRPANVFTSVDGSKWAIWGTNGLYFSNGEIVDGVISSKLQQQDKPVLSWIVLGSDNKTLELCSYDL